MRNIRNESRNREIAFGAIALSLSIIFLGLSYVLPLSSLFMMIFIPFLVALLAFHSSYRTQLVYLIAVLIVSCIDIQDGIFYLLPNTIIGLVYGNLVKHKVDRIILFLATATISFILSYVAIYPIKAIFQVDLFEVFAGLFNLEVSKFQIVAPSFFFLLGVIQTLIMHLSIEGEVKKFNMNFYDHKYQFLIVIGLLLLFAILAISLSIVSLTFAYLFLSYALLLTGISIIYLLLYSKNFMKSVVGISFLLSIFVALPFLSILKSEHYVFTLLSISVFMLLDSAFLLSYHAFFLHKKVDLSMFASEECVVE